ncbi:MAG: replicative DNA helicase [Oscillospiraceae bacterium]
METDIFDNIKQPFSIEAEQSVLGAILLEPDIISEVISFVKIDYFYNRENKKIFSAMVKMFTVGQSIDIVTVLNEIDRDKVFDTYEKAKVYLTSVVQVVPTISNLKSYADILEEKYLLRSLLKVSKGIAESATSSDVTAKALLDITEQNIYDIRQGKDIEGLKKIDEIIVETYDRLQEMSSKDYSGISGLSTGFSDIDRVLSGLNKSDLILMAARPGMGKTSFALNLATNVAKRNKKSVAIFSLEMGKEQLVSRVLSSEGNIPSQNLKNGRLSSDQWIRLAEVSDVISNCDIYIDDSSNITVASMKAKLRRLKGLGLVVIDYLQLMTTGKRVENRVQEISEITRNLKILARELDVPVVTLSQLSRGPEARINNHRPMLSDLRDSGSIEQDADIVMFLYRDSYYNKDMEEDRNVAECIIAKNRHGELNTVKLNWNGEFTKFTSLEVFKNDR